MILVGWSTAAALLIPGIWGALLAVVLGQLQMLVDCCDGEVARWRRTSSPAGVFLDKVGHYTTEALIPLALGIRAAAYPLEFPADFLWTTDRRAPRARHRAQQGAQRHGARRARERRAAEARRHARRDRAARRPDREAPQGGALPAVPPALPLGRADAHRVRRGHRRASSSASRSSTASWSLVLLPLAILSRVRALRRDHGLTPCPFLTAAPGRPACVAASAGRRGRAHDGHPARRPRTGHPERARPAGRRRRRGVRRQRLGPGDRRPGAAGGREDPAPAREPRHPGGPQPRRPRGARRRAVLPRRRRLPARCAVPGRRMPHAGRAARARPHPAPRRRPHGQGLAPAVDPAHPQGRPGALEQRVLVLGGRGAHAARGVRRDRRLGRSVLLRARGHRARLAGVGHRSRRLVRGRPRGGASGDRPGPARLLLPAERPQPRVARAAQPAAACSCRSTWARGRRSRCCAGRATRRRCGRGSAAGARAGASTRGSGARCAGARCGA